MNFPVVILNWNNAADTVGCVRSVQNWTRLKPEIWVVDNASTDGSADVIQRECPTARLLRNPENRGFAGGNNAAIRAILAENRAETILLLNNDADLDETGALTLLEALARHPKVGILGPAVDEGGRVSTGGRNIAWHLCSRRWDGVAAAEGELIEADYVSGTAALVRAEVFRAAGLLDENYFFSGEMADLCERAKRRGFLCRVCPAARAAHATHRASARRDTLYAYYSLRNRFLYVRKFHPLLKVALIPGWAACGLLIGGRALLAGQTAKVRAVALALRDGVQSRYGDRNDEFIR